MEQQSVTHGSFVIERSYPAEPARVFAAFTDPKKKRRWFAEREGLEHYEMDFRVGGVEQTRTRGKEGTPIAGTTLTNTTTYQDIVPGRRIVIAYTMSVGDKRISASLATIEFLPDGAGTKLVFTDQGAYFEGADGPQIREHGWRQIL